MLGEKLIVRNNACPFSDKVFSYQIGRNKSFKTRSISVYWSVQKWIKSHNNVFVTQKKFLVTLSNLDIFKKYQQLFE